MTLLMRDREKIEEGRREGIKEGIKEGSRYGDAKRLVSAVQKMMDKYHFSFEDACDGCDATVEEYHKAVELLKKEDIT